MTNAKLQSIWSNIIENFLLDFPLKPKGKLLNRSQENEMGQVCLSSLTKGTTFCQVAFEREELSCVFLKRREHQNQRIQGNRPCHETSKWAEEIIDSSRR